MGKYSDVTNLCNHHENIFAHNRNLRIFIDEQITVLFIL